MPKIGRNLPRLLFKKGPHQESDRAPAISPNFEDTLGKNGPPKWPHFRRLIAAKDCSDLGRKRWPLKEGWRRCPKWGIICRD